MVAAAEALEHRHAAPAKTRTSPGCVPGSNFELDCAVERLDRDRRAERRLHDRQVDLREDVVALAHEALVGADVHEHVQITRAPAERTGVTFARETDPLAVVDPGGNLDLERPLLERPPGAVARLARMLDDAAGAAALRAGRRADELAEDAARRPAAVGRCRRSAGRSRPPCPAATPSPPQVAHATATSTGTLTRRAARGLGEVDLDLGGDVAAARGRAARAAAEQIVAEERARRGRRCRRGRSVVGVNPPERRPAWP